MKKEIYSTENSAYATDSAAMSARNARAKYLRGCGFLVKCSTWDFSGMGYPGKKYFIEYEAKGDSNGKI